MAQGPHMVGRVVFVVWGLRISNRLFFGGIMCNLTGTQGGWWAPHRAFEIMLVMTKGFHIRALLLARAYAISLSRTLDPTFPALRIYTSCPNTVSHATPISLSL